MTSNPEPTTPESTTSAPAGSGRPIELVPVQPGFWLIIGGGAAAALGPLFGFLIGSMIGTDTDTGEVSPQFLALFAGIVVGGLGVGSILRGVRRLVSRRRRADHGDA